MVVSQEESNQSLGINVSNRSDRGESTNLEKVKDQINPIQM